MKAISNVCSQIHRHPPTAAALSVLGRSGKFRFCNEAQQQILDISEKERSHKSDENDLFESITKSETFQELTSESNNGHSSDHWSAVKWNREHSKLWTVDESVTSSGIMNARSIQEIRNELERIKSRSLSDRRSASSNRIMDILDDLAASTKIDEENVETETAGTTESDPSADLSSDSAADGQKDTDISNYSNLATLTHSYYKAIRQCAKIKEFDEGQKLYDEALQLDAIGRSKVLSALVFVKMHQDFSRNQFEECMKMKKEAQNEGVSISPALYAELLKNANMLNAYRRSRNIVDEVLRSEDSLKLLESKPLKQQIITFYSKTNIAEGLKFMSHISQEFGSEVLDQVMFAAMFSGMALHILRGDQSIMEAAEKLFGQMFKVLGNAPDEAVFNSFLKCYASIPDIDSCVDMVGMMRNKEEWASPSALTYAQCLKCLTLYRSEPLSFEEGWNHVDALLAMMKEDGQRCTEVSYGSLFTLCGGESFTESDLGKLYHFYDQMVADKVKMAPRSGDALLMSGVSHFERELAKNPAERERIMQEVKQFVDWVLLQFQTYNLKLNMQQRQKLEEKLQSM